MPGGAACSVERARRRSVLGAACSARRAPRGVLRAACSARRAPRGVLGAACLAERVNSVQQIGRSAQLQRSARHSVLGAVCLASAQIVFRRAVANPALTAPILHLAHLPNGARRAEQHLYARARRRARRAVAVAPTVAMQPSIVDRPSATEEQADEGATGGCLAGGQRGRVARRQVAEMAAPKMRLAHLAVVVQQTQQPALAARAASSTLR
ncbi:hypothetical protein T492DRAFT_865892 [Pavlovales sp. CCMP2436]|nr:hypothetical protein T492DRAFT_865892 [Pavlovales sp. CCMP2436]